MKHIVIGLMVVGFAATGSLAGSDPNLPHDGIFTGAVSDNWNVANNWYELEVPDGNRLVYIGCPEYPNKSATIYSGTTAKTSSLLVGGGDRGSLTIQAGGTLLLNNEGIIGGYDGFFDNRWLPFDISDDNDWLDGGTATLTVNGTISHSAGVLPIEICARGQSEAKVYLNSGGLIDTGGTGGYILIGKEYHYERAGYFEVYHADGATVRAGNTFLMAAHHDHSDSFYKMSGGVITTGIDQVNLGNFNVWNGIFWVDGGTATINVTSPPGWGYALFIDYSISGQDPEESGEGNDVPVLRFSGNNPLLKVNGWAAFTGAKLDLDANTLVIPGWQWVTVVDANSMAEHTDWTFSAGANVYESNDLTFAAGVDTNIWSMKTDNDKVQIKVSKRGDMDKDSKYTVDDINPFVMALTDPNAYLLAYGIDPNLIGDCDYSGKLDTDDISPFVAFITGGASAVPEPACIGVIALGAAAFIRRRRRK